MATWTYDAIGRTSTVRPEPNTSYQHRYNNKNQLIELVSADSTVLKSWSFDGLGRLSRAVNNNLDLAVSHQRVQTDFTYDWLGRISSETSQVGARPARVVSSSFTANTTLAWQPVSKTTTRPDGVTTVDDFDSLGRQTRLTRGAGITTDFGWTADLLTEQTSIAPNSLIQTLAAFDSFAQPSGWSTQMNGLNVLSLSILRDVAGRVGSYVRQDWRPPNVAAPVNTWRGYEYDNMRRVAKIHEAISLPTFAGVATPTVDGSQVQVLATQANAKGWTYQREPNVGSVLSIIGSGGKERLLTSARDPGYQLRDYRRTSNEQPRVMSYDPMGRVVADGPDTYSWSPLSELRSAGTERLQYDGLGRLVARIDPTGLVEEYVYDGAQMIAALGGSGNVVWSATWGPGLDNLVSIKRGDATFLALGDGRGSIGSYVNESTRRVAATLDYTPEGRVNWRTFDANGNQNGECDQVADPELECPVGPEQLPFGFHGAFKSPVSGLVYFRNRWLSTRTGEWLSRDPLGAVDSPNLYAFNAFDSINRVDLLGLSSKGPGVTSVEFDPITVEGERALLKPGPSVGLTSIARASEREIADATWEWETIERETENAFRDIVMFEVGVGYGVIEGAIPGASRFGLPPGGPRPLVLGRAVGNILGGLIDLVGAVGAGGAGLGASPGTGGATAVVGLEGAAVLGVNGTASIFRGVSGVMDLALQAANNGGKGPPGSQPSSPPPSGAPPGGSPS